MSPRRQPNRRGNLPVASAAAQPFGGLFVHPAPVTDRQDAHGAPRPIDLVNDPKSPHPKFAQPLELPKERLAEVWIRRKGAKGLLDAPFEIRWKTPGDLPDLRGYLGPERYRPRRFGADNGSPKTSSKLMPLAPLRKKVRLRRI